VVQKSKSLKVRENLHGLVYGLLNRGPWSEGPRTLSRW